MALDHADDRPAVHVVVDRHLPHASVVYATEARAHDCLPRFAGFRAAAVPRRLRRGPSGEPIAPAPMWGPPPPKATPASYPDRDRRAERVGPIR